MLTHLLLTFKLVGKVDYRLQASKLPVEIVAFHIITVMGLCRIKLLH